MAHEESTPQEVSPKAMGKGRWKTPAIVAGLMLTEGVGIFLIMKMVSPAPQVARAADEMGTADDPLGLNNRVEIVLCDISAFNRKEGRLFVYNATISVLVDADDQDKIARFVEVREQSIKDRIQVIFRSADPKDLGDPGLESIKRQLVFELNNLLGGKELIRDVLIPKLLQSRANL